jgi:mono/diheme cytochrome c family protein
MVSSKRKEQLAWIVAALWPTLPIGAWTAGTTNPAPAGDGSEPTVCEGVYSAAQAQKGQETYVAQCAQCHGANFRGGFGVASLVGPTFAALWGDKTLWSLFDKMVTTMPLDKPGALSDEGYVEILARILQMNNFPAGDTAELSAQRDVLEKLTVPKACPGPAWK